MKELQFFHDLNSKTDYIIEMLESKKNEITPYNKPMSVLEAANHLNMTKQGIYNRVHLKTIPFHKNGKLYFLREELDAYVNGTWTPTLNK